MPELPEIETLRRALVTLVQGRTVSRLLWVRPDYFHAGKAGLSSFKPGRVESIERRGKYLALHLASGPILIHHLGMSGRLLLVPANAPPGPHTQVRLELDGGGDELRQVDARRFGFFALFTPSELQCFPSWASLGPDPFDLTPAHFHALLRNRQRPLKSLLLDQHVLAGLGNIYADESLHRARLHPTRPAASLNPAEAKRLHRAILTVLKEAIAAGGTSTNDYRKLDGTLGDFQNWLRVYGREGKTCPTCGNMIERIILVGRSAHFCPRCQK